MRIFSKKVFAIVVVAVVLGLVISFAMGYMQENSSNAESNKTQGSNNKTQVVKVEKSSSSGNKRSTRTVPVTYINVKQNNVDIYKKAIGEVVNLNSVKLSSEISGAVLDVKATLGDRVTKGQILARIDNKELLNNKAAQQSEINRLKAQLKEKEFSLSRYIALHKDQYASDAELELAQSEVDGLKEQILNAEASLRTAILNIEKAVVKSPISGIVQSRTMSKGDYITAGSEMFQIVDNSKLVVIASFPESEYKFLKAGQKAVISSVALDDNIISEVKEIKPLLDETSRSIQLVIDINNKNLKLRPGSVADVNILVENKKNAIFIPSEAVVQRYDGKVVYILDQTGTQAIERKIEEGIRKDDDIEVLRGLKSGDKLIMDGAGFLVNGTKINAKPLENR